MMDHTSENEWSPCPPGDLQRMAKSMRARSSRRATLRAAGAAAAAVSVILLSIVGVQYLQGDGAAGDMYFGGISCTDVRRLAPDYMAGHVGEQDGARIRAHLAECPMCQDFLKKIQPQGAGAADQTSVSIVFSVEVADRATEDRISPESIRSLLASLR
jgi:predicted anti-sigma-YlaC factor YlaD